MAAMTTMTTMTTGSSFSSPSPTPSSSVTSWVFSTKLYPGSSLLAGNGFTTPRPSFFELYAVNCLLVGLRPALRTLVRALFRMLIGGRVGGGVQEEVCHWALLAFVEIHSLVTKHASVAEAFYGVQRHPFRSLFGQLLVRMKMMGWIRHTPKPILSPLHEILQHKQKHETMVGRNNDNGNTLMTTTTTTKMMKGYSHHLSVLQLAGSLFTVVGFPLLRKHYKSIFSKLIFLEEDGLPPRHPNYEHPPGSSSPPPRGRNGTKPYYSKTTMLRIFKEIYFRWIKRMILMKLKKYAKYIKYLFDSIDIVYKFLYVYDSVRYPFWSFAYHVLGIIPAKKRNDDDYYYSTKKFLNWKMEAEPKNSEWSSKDFMIFRRILSFIVWIVLDSYKLISMVLESFLFLVIYAIRFIDWWTTEESRLQPTVLPPCNPTPPPHPLRGRGGGWKKTCRHSGSSNNVQDTNLKHPLDTGLIIDRQQQRRRDGPGGKDNNNLHHHRDGHIPFMPIPANPQICILCRKPRQNPACINSGYVFCYRCIFNYVDKHKSCPVTGVYVFDTSGIRRLVQE